MRRRSLLDEFESVLRDLLGPDAEPVPIRRAPPPRRAQAVRQPRSGSSHVWVVALAGVIIAALLGAVVLAWLIAESRSLEPAQPAPTSRDAVNAIVERIIFAESSGDPNAKNKRSSATGAAQFLDETWLRMVRLHRPDLARHSEREVLDLRRDPDLAREITARFAERNAAMLTRRGFAVTPGRLYLSHFAGSGGAVALLLAPEEADAAAVMAAADVTGRTTREKVVKANPFLDSFTVAAIKRWADRKMCGRAPPAQAAAKAAGCE